MNIILLEPIRKLGNTGDVISVKGGYARNFLVPQGLALYATESNMKTLQARMRAKQKQSDLEKASAEKLSETLTDVVLNMTARAGEGKIFGAVTHADVAAAMQSQKGLELDKKRFEMPKAIKELGEYDISYKAHSEVNIPIKLVITAA